jgi:hypothetical protein
VPNIIEDMFSWWNEAMADPDGFTAAAFGQFYSDDARLIVNGQLRSDTLEGMAAHYRRIQALPATIRMALPVDEAFATTDRAFVHCRTLVNPQDGNPTEDESMAYAVLRDGRMTLLRVVGVR